MTINFIYISFGLIIIYDIVAVILQQKKKYKKIGLVTITTIFRKWYSSKHLIPFMVSVIFIGHFYLYKFNPISSKISLWIFISLALIYISIYIYGYIKKTKLYNLLNKYAIIPMALGSIVGMGWN